ncbi:MAG: GNAT family N-acetyltransferase [Phycisphaeraceae bacterium]
MDTKIDILGKQELKLVADLYNQVFQPSRDEAFFQRRLLGRYNELILTAAIDGNPVGFMLGFELKPNTFFEWLYGVLPDARRAGVASQLMDAAHAWARDHGYEISRMECLNPHRTMLHLAISRGFDVMGVRWDPDRHANLVIFEKELGESEA